MSKENDWKQLAQDDIEEYERRQNAKPDLGQKILNVMTIVGIGLLVVFVVWMGFEMDRARILWQLNR